MKNENTVFVILVILFILAFISFVVLIGVFIVNFNKKTRFIIGKMSSTDNRDKYVQLRKELRCHYLCLIPFVNKKNVLNLYNLLFYKPKHKLVQKRTDGIWHIIAPSLIGICLCAVCLCGASWAWFTATQTSSVANIQTATYTVSVTAKKVDTDIQVTETAGIFEIHLEAESAYTITLTADGNAKSGYCKTEFGEAIYYTPQIAPSNVFTFKVKANNAGVLKITPQWGTCAVANNIIESETTLELDTTSVSDNIRRHS